MNALATDRAYDSSGVPAGGYADGAFIANGNRSITLVPESSYI